MLMELIAAFAAGFVGGGVALILRRITGNALPRATVPVLAGLGMLMFAIWSEYSWFSRTSGSLPEGIVVVRSHAEPSGWRPWTYLRPFVNRFAAVDTASIRRNDRVAEQRMAEVLLFGHRMPPVKLPLVVDCVAGRRADIVDGMTFDDRGAVTDADWVTLPPDDPLLKAVCA